MNAGPLVSIVVPCLNHANFIGQAIQSVLAQTYDHVELIVIDGGSTDGSLDIIRRYESHIAHLVSEPDAGQADAINKGLRLARGELVAWLNSDDVYFPRAIATAVSVMRRHPDAALVYGDAAFIDETGQFLRYFTEIEPFDAFRLRNCADFIMQPATFFRRDALQRAGLLNTRLHWVLDWDLWCRLAQQGAVHYEPTLLAANREHPRTKTRTGGVPRLLEVRRLHRRHGDSFWPHAYFSYAAKEMQFRAASETSTWRRAVWTLARALFACAGVRNFLHARRHRRPVRGLHHGTNACERHVEIHVPLYQPARTVEITLANNGPPGAVDLTLNEQDRSRHALPGGCESAIRVDVPPSAARGHELQLHLDFSPSIAVKAVALRRVCYS